MAAALRSGKEVKLSVRIPEAEDEGLLQERFPKDIVLFLIGFRFVNSLCVSTFFQPDEYFQALEPAWQVAFGSQSGAWITWEWKHQLRSSLYPVVFAALYSVSDKCMTYLSTSPQSRALILILLPKILQCLFAAAGDYYTWKLAERIYGRGSTTAWTALLLSLLSPWQWFCSTRTLSNSLETVLTIVALNFWPWALSGDVSRKWSGSATSSSPLDRKHHASLTSGVFQTPADTAELRLCLILAGVACILRPTNLLIWVSLVTISVTRFGLTGLSNAKFIDFLTLLRETILCGAAVILTSAISDRLHFGMWTFPPYQWLNFNITQSLAIFYGKNRWDYYLTEALPLLLTTYLPFAVLALWSSSSTSASTLPAFIANTRFQLAFVIITMVATLSVISHKEVRFIYPLLPSLHILTAPHILSFFNATPLITTIKNASSRAVISINSWRRYLLVALILINLGISIYVTQFHQRGVIDVLIVLRRLYDNPHLAEYSPPQIEIPGHRYKARDPNETFAAFLMPCHSTPWRSHLVYPSLRAWALTCEPPLHIPANTPERSTYRDEADRFYDAPDEFLKREVGTETRPWPRYVVGFEGIEETLRRYLEEATPGKKLHRRWDLFNSHWHDDGRRVGRVVIWELIQLEE